MVDTIEETDEPIEVPPNEPIDVDEEDEVPETIIDDEPDSDELSK